MDLGLKEKVVLVSGASQGIGFAIAHSFAQEGAQVCICSRDESKIQKASRLIEDSTNRRVIAHSVDVTQQEKVKAWVNEIYDQLGSIHVMVTNAGGPKSMPFMQTDDESWHRSIDLTLMSVVHLSQAVIPIMQKQHWGRLIHICSASVRGPIPHLVFSNSIRAAVVALGKTQANELAKDNILVNSVLPGWSNTQRVQELMGARAKQEQISIEAAIAKRLQTIPLNRISEPKEIADPVVFLASEQASFITGTTLTIDGGETHYPF